MKPKRKNVKKVVSPQEEDMLRKAEQMAAQTQAELDANNGRATFGNSEFNLAEDISAMNSLINNEHPSPVNEVPQMPQQQVEQQEDKKEEQQQENNQLQLSEEPEARAEQVSNMYRAIDPTFPSKEQLLQLKKQFGEFFICNLGDQFFIFRYLKRQEWIQLNADDGYQKALGHQKEDILYTKCVIWPNLRPEQLATLPAGSISAVVEQIQLESKFLNPVEVAQYTIKI